MANTAQNSELGVLMTLSAIAYANDKSQKLPDLKKAIAAELSNKSYATGGNWSLAFGPVRYADSDSLLYVAQNQAKDTLALVIRGTAPSKESQQVEYPGTQSPFKYAGMTNANVSATYLWAMKGMVNEVDGTQDLAAFLKSRADNSNGLTIYVTGHSQGGGIAPMLLAWVIGQQPNWTNPKNLKLIGRAFAPLSAGDPGFAGWFAANSDCALVINPLDAIPFCYASIPAIISQSIPTTVPPADQAGYNALNAVAQKGGAWQQIPRQITLTKTPLSPKLSYEQQKDGQHATNSYLYLLGAPQTDVGAPSPMG